MWRRSGFGICRRELLLLGSLLAMSLAWLCLPPLQTPSEVLNFVPLQ